MTVLPSSRPLAIFVPDSIGVRPASFIRRHMEDLLPGGTAVVAPVNDTGSVEGVPASWKEDFPVLDLTRLIGGRLRWRVTQEAAKQFGVKLERVAIKRFLKRYQVQVVMSEYLDFSLQWLGIAQELGIPFFAHGHGDDVMVRLEESPWRAEYLKYNQSAGIIAMSNAGRDKLVAAGLDRSRIHVIPSGVDVPPEAIARPDRDQIRCIAVGRAVAEKAPILLLDAFRRAAEQYPELHLDYVGPGPLMPAVTDFVRAFGLEKKITLHGAQPNETVLELLQQADLFIQHSLREGLGVAILEAMAQTLPVVATRTGGILETVVEGSTGYLVEPGDSAGMAERIVELAGNADLRRRLGLAGWERVRDHFTWERERSELLRVLGLSA